MKIFMRLFLVIFTAIFSFTAFCGDYSVSDTPTLIKIAESGDRIAQT